MLIAFAIFLFTLALVIWQPRGLGIGWSASIGALLALALGSVAPGDIPTVWNIVWNATATFIAVIVISLLLDEAGFFEWPRCTSRAGPAATAGACSPSACCSARRSRRCSPTTARR
ncbi:arsenical pump membrane protein [Pseudomonas aeruginosa]|nr:arsenical pump membrane protein [Pseudomonas aeruginosa]